MSVWERKTAGERQAWQAKARAQYDRSMDARHADPGWSERRWEFVVRRRAEGAALIEIAGELGIAPRNVTPLYRQGIAARLLRARYPGLPLRQARLLDRHGAAVLALSGQGFGTAAIGRMLHMDARRAKDVLQLALKWQQHEYSPAQAAALAVALQACAVSRPKVRKVSEWLRPTT